MKNLSRILFIIVILLFFTTTYGGFVEYKTPEAAAKAHGDKKQKKETKIFKMGNGKYVLEDPENGIDINNPNIIFAGKASDKGDYIIAGSIFKEGFFSEEKAALEWAEHYGKLSIDSNKEYASVIYKYIKDGITYYGFTTAQLGKEGHCHQIPEFTYTLNGNQWTVFDYKDPTREVVAGIHGHGGYDKDYTSNYISEDDANVARNSGRPEIAFTPTGAMLKIFPDGTVNEEYYIPSNQDNIPYDENDPTRKKSIGGDDEVLADNIKAAIRTDKEAFEKSKKADNSTNNSQKVDPSPLYRPQLAEESNNVKDGFICKFAPNCTCGVESSCGCSDGKEEKIAGIIMGATPVEISPWDDFVEDMTGVNKKFLDALVDVEADKFEEILKDLQKAGDAKSLKKAKAVTDILNAVTDLIEKGDNIGGMDLLAFAGKILKSSADLGPDLLKALKIDKAVALASDVIKGLGDLSNLFSAGQEIGENWDSMSKVDVVVKGTEAIVEVAGAKYKLAYEGGKLVAYSMATAIFNRSKCSEEEVEKIKSEIRNFLKIDSMSAEDKNKANNAINAFFFDVDEKTRLWGLTELLKYARNAGGDEAMYLMTSVGTNWQVGDDHGFRNDAWESLKEKMRDFDYSNAPTSCQCPPDCHCIIKKDENKDNPQNKDEDKEDKENSNKENQDKNEDLDKENKEDKETTPKDDEEDDEKSQDPPTTNPSIPSIGNGNGGGGGGVIKPITPPNTPSIGSGIQLPISIPTPTPSEESTKETSSDRDRGDGIYTVIDTPKTPAQSIEIPLEKEILEKAVTTKIPIPEVKIPDVPTGADLLKKIPKLSTKYKKLELKKTETSVIINSSLNSGHSITSDDSSGNTFSNRIKEKATESRDSKATDISEGL